MIDGVTVTDLSSARFIYNGWDIIAEYSVLNGSTLDKLQRTYAWGVDIAGSLSKAGGVGALLQFANTTTGTAFMPSYDGNGNVASLINLGTGALAAVFEFSPYGEMLRDEIHDNAVAPFALRFSTKWCDAETGWLNYGRRYFDPRNGRFIGRDPIAEEGGINLYAFCGNNPVDRWDRLGMDYVAAPSGSYRSDGSPIWVEFDGMTIDERADASRAAANQQDFMSYAMNQFAYYGAARDMVAFGNAIAIGDIQVLGRTASGDYIVASYSGDATQAMNHAAASYSALTGNSSLLASVNTSVLSGGPGRAEVTIGPLQSYTGPNEGAFYIPVPGDVPSNVEGILRDPGVNPGEICIQCHGVSAFGFSGNVNDFAGLSAIPGSGPNAQQGYKTVAFIAEQATYLAGPGIAGGLARMGVSATVGGVREGAIIYRVFGGEAGGLGRSWTTVAPDAVADFRATAGLFEGNTAEYVITARLQSLEGVSLRAALPGPTTPPGALQIPELLFEAKPVPGVNLDILSVGGWPP